MNLFKLFLNLDESLFLTLNNNFPHTYVLDQLFLFFSFHPWIVWLMIGFLLMLVQKDTEKIFMVRLVLALVLAGWLASGMLKPIIRRPRPDIKYGARVQIVQEKPAVISWSNDYAFPSGHAAVAFAGCCIVSSGLRKKRRKPYWLLYLLATLTAFSRIYLGKHYPLDVFTGAMLGVGSAWLAWKIGSQINYD